MIEESLSLLRDALSGYWLHQDDRYSRGKLNKDKLMDVPLELKKAPINGVGKGM